MDCRRQRERLRRLQENHEMKKRAGSRAALLAVGSAATLLGVTACQGTQATNLGYVPASGASTLERPAAIGQTYIYAATLDWNTGSGSVFVYDAYGKKSSPIRSIAISPGFSEGLWTDSKGNVYVAVVNAGSNGRGYVSVYTPGLRKLLRTYTTGLDGPSGGTFDAAGNMYVSNICGTAPSMSCSVFLRTRGHASGGTSGYVAIYPPGEKQPSTYLQSPINIAVGVALDRANNVFVVNNTGQAAWNVVEFPAGADQGKVVPFKNLPSQRWVGAVAFSPHGALVASVNSAIDFFPHERGKPAHALTNGVVAADGLAYGPDGTLFAGNYEFEQNEGNVIAFPPREASPDRSYAVPYNNGVTGVTIGAAASMAP
jgi:hypothetical protein